MGILETVGTVLSLANSAKSLFSKSKSEKDSMEDQLQMQLESARQMPSAQVAGLRAAGLNPMLAIGHGIQSPPNITASPGAEEQAHSAKQQAATAATVAAAQVQNLNSASAKNVADADLAREQAQTEESRRNLMGAQTAQTNVAAAFDAMRTSLTEQNWKTEGFTTKIRELEHSLLAETYGDKRNQISVALDTARAELRSARTKAQVDEALLKYERIAAMSNQATGAVSNLIPFANLFKNSAKSVTRSGSSYVNKGTRTFQETTIHH